MDLCGVLKKTKHGLVVVAVIDKGATPSVKRWAHCANHYIPLMLCKKSIYLQILYPIFILLSLYLLLK